MSIDTIKIYSYCASDRRKTVLADGMCVSNLPEFQGMAPSAMPAHRDTDHAISDHSTVLVVVVAVAVAAVVMMDRRHHPLTSTLSKAHE